MMISEIKAMARGNWPDIISNVCNVSLDMLTGGHGPCPRCGGKDRFRVFEDFVETGGTFCNQCGPHSDGISTVAGLRDCSPKDAVNVLAEYLHIKPVRKPQLTSKPQLTDDERHQRDRIYRSILQLSLNEKHRAQLRRRGLSDDAIDRRGYVSMSKLDPKRVAGLLEAELRKEGPSYNELARCVPGLLLNGGGAPMFPNLSGILIPVRNADGLIVALIVRMDDDDKNSNFPKYLYFSASQKQREERLKQDGFLYPKAEYAIHVPIDVSVGTESVRVTEGVLKADIATELSGMSTIAIPGVSGWKRVIPVLQQLSVKRVLISFDSDHKENPAVADSLAGLTRQCVAEGFVVGVETWDIREGKGIDDVLANEHQPKLIEGDAVEQYLRNHVDPIAAQARKPDKGHFDCPEPNESDSRVIVEVTNDEHAVNEQVITLLADDPELFQRAGELVHVVTDVEVSDSIHKSPGGTRIRHLPLAALRDRISQRVDFRKRKVTKNGEDLNQINPPDSCVRAIHCQGSWPGIRPLTGLITTPTIRPDGTFISTPGYDEKTGLYLRPYGEIPDLPENPSQQDAREAAARLRNVFADFPFALLKHFSVLLAYLLTLLGRHAFAGPSPLILLDANVRGSGKTLLVDLVSIIFSGHEMSRMTNPGDDDEFRKRITALVMAGESTVLIDNIDGKFGCPSLDCALTSTSWKDRPLGRSEIVELPLRITWAATGNNIMLVGDASRRVACIRLKSLEERPEERKEFRHADIKGYVREHRTELLADALTILSAFINAGRPDQKLSSWGSFEGWSETVRQAVAWCGLPDPGLTRKELVESSDTEAIALRQFLQSWGEIDPDRNGLTCSEVLKKLAVAPDEYPAFRSALLELVPPQKDGLPSVRQLGNQFRRHRQRVLDGWQLDYDEERSRSRLWCVMAVKPNQSTTEPQLGDTGDTDDSI